MVTISIDPFPNFTWLERGVRACFDGTTFDEQCLQVHLELTRNKLNADDGRFRQGIEVLESGDSVEIKAWLLNLEALLS